MTRLIIINSEKFGLSPAEKQFAIHWLGNLSQAILNIDMQTSFGYGLTSVIINGTTFKPDSDSHFSKDVKDLLLQGNNKVTVIFNALQVLGYPLGQTQITATLDYYGGTVIGTPSVQQAIANVENTLSKNFGKVLLGIAGFAIIAGSLAFISSRLPNAGKVDVGDVAHSAHQAAKEATSHVKHAIMTIKEKV
ncbi:MAG: hypothetical protein ACREBJ_02160 [Nitrosotalea sp.]